MSIDQSIEAGKPRTFSVDSVDYTTMLVGDEEEAVKEEVRRRRKNRKPKKLFGRLGRMKRRDYAKAIGKGKKCGAWLYKGVYTAVRVFVTRRE